MERLIYLISYKLIADASNIFEANNSSWSDQELINIKQLFQ